jgi:hypothetical protein
MESTVRQHEPNEMFPAHWLDARTRALTEPLGEEFQLLVGLLDTGGLLISRIHTVAADGFQHMMVGNSWDALTDFVRDDITDTFRTIALGAAALIPHPGWENAADPLELEGEVRILMRYLRVATLAADQPPVPGEIRREFQEVETATTTGWGPAIVQTIRGIAQKYLVPVRD